tara:strand:+ start:3662 stop:3922 length:261 start_codon:yes stop_codon:yes gene_type:complete
MIFTVISFLLVVFLILLLFDAAMPGTIPTSMQPKIGVFKVPMLPFVRWSITNLDIFKNEDGSISKMERLFGSRRVDNLKMAQVQEE